MLFNWKEGPLAEGLRCYRNREFFLAHEHWECIWLTCQGPEKTFLQALIQVTAAFHHLQRNNPEGATSLLRAALRRLDGVSADFGGIAVEALREDVATWLAALSQDPIPPVARYPLILQSEEARSVATD